MILIFKWDSSVENWEVRLWDFKICMFLSQILNIDRLLLYNLHIKLIKSPSTHLLNKKSISENEWTSIFQVQSAPPVTWCRQPERAPSVRALGRGRHLIFTVRLHVSPVWKFPHLGLESGPIPHHRNKQIIPFSTSNRKFTLYPSLIPS